MSERIVMDPNARIVVTPETTYADISIQEMGLSIHTFNSLNKAKLKTLQNIVDYMYEHSDMSFSGLMKLRNFGKKNYDELIAKMDEIAGMNFAAAGGVN